MMPTSEVLVGDNVLTLAARAEASVQCVVTSPPYWSVRDYGTEPVQFPAVRFRPAVGLPSYRVPEQVCQLGLEPEPWHFIGHLLHCFRAVWRVLRQDGVLFVNIGDTYYTGAGSTQAGAKILKRGKRSTGRHSAPNRRRIAGMEPKNLTGIPWMFAKAMQADGWTLRSEIINRKSRVTPAML